MPSGTMRIRPNRRRRVMRAWLAVSIVAAFVMLAPFLFEGQAEFLDFSQLGGAMALVGFFVFLTGLITAGFYRTLARTEDKVRRAAENEPSVLHRWTYAEDEWAAFAHEAWKKDRSRMTAVWILIAAVTVVLIPVTGLLTGDFAFAILFSLGLVAFLAIFAFGAPLARRAKMRRAPREVIVSRQGIVVGSSFLPFDAALVTLESVDFKDGWLSFTTVSPSRTGPQDWTVDVWVPARLRAAVDASLRATFGTPTAG